MEEVQKRAFSENVSDTEGINFNVGGMVSLRTGRKDETTRETRRVVECYTKWINLQTEMGSHTFKVLPSLNPTKQVII